VQREVDELRAELAELHGIVADVTTLLREQADRDVAALRAKLQSVLLRLSRRDVGLPLH
jgi:hypothetical protein